MNKSLDKLKLISSMIIFGTIGAVRRYIPYSSSIIAFVRGTVGTLFLLLVSLIKKEKFNFGAIKQNLPVLCVSGVLLAANWILLFEAYRYTSVAVATVCYYMAPVFVILVSPFFLHEALTVKKGLCSLVAVIGMVMVSGVIETGFSGIRGVVFGLIAASMYAGIIILNKFIRNLSGNERTMIQLGISAVILLPYVIITEDFSSLTVNPFIISMLAVAGIVHTGIAYTFYFGSIKNIPAQTVALLSYLDPIIAVILSVVLLNEKISVISGVGIVLVIGATLLSEIDFGKKEN